MFEAGSGPDPFQVLTGEHALIRLHLARTLEAARTDVHGRGAREAFAAFEMSFRVHQRREDLVMYPECERLFGGPDGVASVLREDHDAIHRILEPLAAGTGRPPRVDVEALERVRDLLEGHFAKEERVLFPLMMAYLPGKESANLARRLRAAAAP